MQDTVPVRPTNRRRLGVIIVLLMVSGFAWASWSLSSPWYGWIGDAIEAARLERLRSTATPPCRSAEWTPVQLDGDVHLEVPSCYESTLDGSGAVLLDGTSGTLIAVSLYRGETSGWMAPGTVTFGWDHCARPERSDIYCRVQESLVAGRGVTFRSRMVVAPRSAILIQTLLPAHLSDTSHEEAVIQALDEIALRSSQPVEFTAATATVATDSLQSWLASRQARFAIMITVAQGT